MKVGDKIVLITPPDGCPEAANSEGKIVKVIGRYIHVRFYKGYCHLECDANKTISCGIRQDQVKLHLHLNRNGANEN